MKAMEHARKYLAPQWDVQRKKISEAAVLLASPMNASVEKYKVGPSLIENVR